MNAYTRQPPKPCPHCGHEYATTGGNFHRHVSHCVRDPAFFAVTRAGLDDGNGCIRGLDVYAHDRRGGLGRNALLGQIGGGWAEVAAFFGLQPRDKTLTPAQVRAREAAQAAAQVVTVDDAARWAAEDEAARVALASAQREGCAVARVTVSGCETDRGADWVRVEVEEWYLLR